MKRPPPKGTIASCCAIACASAFACVPAQMLAQKKLQSIVKSCQEDSVRVGLPRAFNERPIRNVDIVTHGPRSLRVVGAALDRLHTRTRVGTIRRELLFSPGGRLDSLDVAESLRRLRSLGFLDDAFIVARSCNSATDGDSVDVTVVTRDAWSTSATAATHSSGGSVGITERNLLGTGRTLRVGLQADHNGFNRSISLRDPALFGTDLIGDIRLSQFSHGASWQVALATRRRALVDPWIFDARVFSYDRGQRDLITGASKRVSISGTIGRRITDVEASSAVYFLTGAEGLNSRFSAAPNQFTIGPPQRDRRYVGALVGLAVQATHFDTLSWLLPSGGIVDVPKGVETQFVVGPGRDLLNHQYAAHLDSWIGAAHTIGSKSVVYSDAWISAFVGNSELEQTSMRASVVTVRSAWRGTWSLHVTGDHMRSLDPDIRLMPSVDVTSRLLPTDFRMANDAVAFAAERSVHLREIIRGSMIDAALFAAASLRHEPSSSQFAFPQLTTGQVLPARASVDASVIAFGTGLRLLPSRSPRSTVRLDIGLASIKTIGVKNKPYIAISVVPWIGAGRRRDANRQQ
ncbi:MAG: hypothetical protein ABJC26_04100 [Gemmatimonadaceae bacterium]